jgi:hypothetical protein
MSTYDVSFEENNNIGNSNNRQKREAKEIIENDLPIIIGGNRGMQRLAKKPLVRLDLQGIFPHNGIRYANLQIQLNSTTASDGLREEEGEEVVTDGGAGRNRSTTIAIVLMPCDEEIPQPIMQKAFNVSLDEGKKATISKRR